jgi:hypothetical protein
MDAAASYANETWGVPTPKSLKPYTSAQLHGLSKKVKDWKKKREEEGEDSKGKEKYEKETKESSCNSGRCKMSSSLNQKGKFNLKMHREAVGLSDIWEEATPVKDTGQADYESRQNRGKKKRKGDYKRKETMPSVDVQFETFEEMIEHIKIKDPHVWGIIGNELTGVERETGVASQVGEETWDVRQTISQLDKDGRVKLAFLLSHADDLDNPNTKWGPYIWEGYSRQPDGSKAKSYFTKSKGRTFRIANDIIRMFHSILAKIGRAKIEQSILKSEKDYMPFADLDDISRQQKYEEQDIIQQHLGYDPTKESKNVNEKKVLSGTIKNLIRIAKDMDDSGSYKDAEEVHKVIRKYKDKLGGK